VLTLQRSGRAECPARSALTLVFDGCHVTLKGFQLSYFTLVFEI
jgi:hypothetical protein